MSDKRFWGWLILNWVLVALLIGGSIIINCGWAGCSYPTSVGPPPVIVEAPEFPPGGSEVSGGLVVPVVQVEGEVSQLTE